MKNEMIAEPVKSIGKYKQTEIGIIPDEWHAIELKSLITVARGGSPRPIQSFLTNSNNGINWIKIGDTKQGSKYIYSAEEKIIESGKQYSRQVASGDFLLSNSMSFGRPYILKIDGCIHDGWLVLQNYQEAFDTEYLYYTLSSNYMIKQYLQRAAGSSVLNLNKEIVSSVILIKPPKIEQTAIAKALSDADAMIASLEKLIEKKKKIKQGAMQDLLSSTGSDGKLKEGWVEMYLTEIVNYIHGKAHEQDISENGMFTVVNSKFVSSNGEVAKYSNVNNCPARKGDVLTVLSDLPNGKALAKCFLVDADRKYAVNQRVCIWRTKGADSKFLSYILNRHKYFLGLDDGVSQTHILNKHIEGFRLMFPTDLNYQRESGEVLGKLDEEISLLEAKLNKCQKVKQGMMQNLLTGKIRLV
jgi:type I restriction enzyme S subunit